MCLLHTEDNARSESLRRQARVVAGGAAAMAGLPILFTGHHTALVFICIGAQVVLISRALYLLVQARKMNN